MGIGHHHHHHLTDIDQSQAVAVFTHSLAVTMIIHPFHCRASLIMRLVLSTLALAGLLASPAQARDKSLRAGAAPASAPSVIEPEQVSRLIIRYRDGIKGAAAGSATPSTERAEAQAVVSRSAVRAGVPSMRYIKSVSPSVQVVALDQPVSAAEAQAMVLRLQADPAVLDAMVDQRARPRGSERPQFFQWRSVALAHARRGARRHQRGAGMEP